MDQKKILIPIDEVEIPQQEIIVKDDISESDFLYGDSETLSIGNIPKIKSWIWLKYNQWNKFLTSSACTIVSRVRTVLYIISSLFWLEPTEWQVDDAVRYAIKDSWYVEWKWWRVYMWVNSVRKYWNETNPDKQVTSAAINFYHEDFWEVFKRVPLVSSYKWNLEYNRDYQTDCVLDLKKLETEYSYWHCIAETFDEKVMVHDNYHPKKYNEYEIKHLSDLIKNWVQSRRYSRNKKEKIRGITNKREKITTSYWKC